MMNRDLSIFIGQLLRRPHEVVALAPSSTGLARLMCEGLGPDTGLVAELGPGTGKITRAILERGVPPKNLTAFELNPNFCEILQEEIAGPTFLNEPAQHVGNLGEASLDAVISGLPLLSMPIEVQRQIVEGAFHALKPGGEFVQFTYGPVPPVAEDIREALDLHWSVSKRIWGNLPPAKVYRFRKEPVLN